jgi:hypothetical protein
MALSSGSSFETSKMAPQLGRAFHEILIAADLVVEL